MSMKKNSKSSSMKRTSNWFALGLILIMIVSSQFSQADCRALRSTTNTVGANGDCEQAGGSGHDQMVGMSSFAVSSNNSDISNSTSRPLARSLAFRLASGPSKKGPGH
ncbi:hypothetical protein L484_006804 [Morus notabilis]|uniref:Transmembrane protein n=1 Tax=Morus notabilis TaxID=981085 RepID=W9RP69_9ROSA|nr:uncharacterized protein LOC21390222 [Morus notabilis]EXB89250.1 hypothetical protein L484_006804 [Morus notabilis]